MEKLDMNALLFWTGK